MDARILYASLGWLLIGTCVQAELVETPAAIGPMIGHASATSANIWYRPATTGKYTLRAHAEGEKQQVCVDVTSSESTDRCVTWRLQGLNPATRYQYSIYHDSEALCLGEEYYFHTAPANHRPSQICLAFGSCARNQPLPLWTQMAVQGADGIVLLGDTPYIDSTNLSVARQRHREFLAIPQLAAVIRHLSVWGTWDDHDFGANDSDGRLSGKVNTRRALVEYRANGSYGEEDEGIYTKFRYGPVEVFLLDTRWFARTEPSPISPQHPTLLGARQWNWLLQSLQDSTAPFKLICCGMIWDDKRNSESDDWGSYTHERNALFDFLGESRISGVVLVGGDIHCSRLLRYKTEQQVGYPIHQFIVSPIHDSTIPDLNVDHPDLVIGRATPHVWLRLQVDTTRQPAELHARWVQMQGEQMWDITLSEEQLRRE